MEQWILFANTNAITRVDERVLLARHLLPPHVSSLSLLRPPTTQPIAFIIAFNAIIKNSLPWLETVQTLRDIDRRITHYRHDIQQR